MSDAAIMVFTRIGLDRMLEEGGSRAWHLNPRNAKNARYLVCTRNRSGAFAEGDEDHGSAFMVGTISNIVPAPSEPERYLIQIDSYALVDIPHVWDGSRNPVRYTTLSKIGIDPQNLEFRAIDNEATASPHPQEQAHDLTPGLSIQQAKPKIARYYGVAADAVEVIIRG